MAQDLDHFTYHHPDFLSIFAAGNSGASGYYTIITPGNAKNALAVGALQLRDIFTDELLGSTLESIASFSSIGPTPDGRIKPDIVAPGDYISKLFLMLMSSAYFNTLVLQCLRMLVSQLYCELLFKIWLALLNVESTR